MECSCSLESPALLGHPSALQAAMERDCNTSVGALRDLVRDDPAVREALFLASPSLDAARDAWLAEPASSRAQGVTTIVLCYVARGTAGICVRIVPFRRMPMSCAR
jgi:hypothetical protein